MKLNRTQNRQAGFTMVEIAICLGVIVFAMVAIIGVLPLGINVQKDNREETIINQDATYFLDAIRKGARGLDDLTNYLVAVSNFQYQFTADGTFVPPAVAYGFTVSNYTVNGSLVDPQFPLTNGACIIGVLSTPKFVPINGGADGYYSNYVFASFHALSGPSADKFPENDERVRDFAFGYRLSCELVPIASLTNVTASFLTTRTNLHDVRLIFRWPLLGRGVGNNRMTFRTQLAASLLVNTENPRNLYYFDPNNLVFVSPP